jgi:uncharacterized sulfatase
LEKNTFAAFGDFDASPTKVFLGLARDRPEMSAYVEYAFGRRPAEELYDLRTDPHQLTNVASLARYQEARSHLGDRLLKVLETSGDPRVIENNHSYDKPPFAGPLNQ